MASLFFRGRPGLLSVAAVTVVVSAVVTAAGAATVNPTISTDYLPNPGIGFQAMHDLDDPVLPETVAYRRQQYGWDTQNPAQGVYDWSPIDADIAAAAALGKQLSFRIYTMRGEIFGGHRVPAWVLSEGAQLLGNGQPKYSDCVYQQRWSEFVEAMRVRYDGNPDIAFLDISGYGNFNEWSWHSQTEWDDDALNPTTLDGMGRKRLADMFIGGSGTITCTLAGGGTQQVSYSYPGFQQTQLVMPNAGIRQSTWYVASRRLDVGFRHDCLGSPSHTDHMYEDLFHPLETLWRTAPIAYELCGQEDLDLALDLLRLTHGTIVHENNGGNDVEHLAATLRDAGYRFTLVEATFPDVSFFTGDIDVELTLRNVGFAPAYAKMGQDFELRAYLLEPDGDVGASWTLASDPNDWLPAHPIGSAVPDQDAGETLTLPGGLHLASYTFAVGILDLRTGDHIALANEGTDDDELLPLGTIVFSNGEICGDGLQRADLGEECDDGNIADGDCCSSGCLLEAGSCDDADPCTTVDTCSAGTCVGSVPLACDDGIGCTIDSCETGLGCIATPDHSACDDSIVCTADVCTAGVGCSNDPDDSLCDDADLCTTEVCNPSTLECDVTAEPQTSCDTAASVSFTLSDAKGKQKLAWNWKNGSVSTATLGDPTEVDGTAHALCVFSGSTLAFSANVPAGLLCGATSSCWDLRDDRLSFSRGDATPEGVSSISIRAGRPGKDKVQWKGKYSPLAVPEPMSPGFLFDPGSPVVVQTVNTEGACQQATFEGASVRKHDADTFKGIAK